MFLSRGTYKMYKMTAISFLKFIRSISQSFQLVEALKEQEEINFRLRQYMDKIILAILDHNPSILEIKH